MNLQMFKQIRERAATDARREKNIGPPQEAVDCLLNINGTAENEANHQEVYVERPVKKNYPPYKS